MDAQPWLKSYPGRRPLGRPDRARAAAERARDVRPVASPTVPALQFMDKRISYAELNALADRAASGFQKLGVGPGVHVGLFMPNTPHYVIALFGVLKAGGVIVNYSPLDALSTLEFKIEDSETDILVTLDLAAVYPQAEKLLATTRLKRLVVGAFAEYAAAPEPVTAFLTGARHALGGRRPTNGMSRSATSRQRRALRDPPDRRSDRDARGASSTPAARPACRRARC